ncbi:ABC transporter substrate-binding protein [Amycolatopsis endophytica]|uniref:Peptide/nickel transport system substrate-binding protein n=1 Tax=Amycolatopsis endophytica TaxID=860233 RepID=A0A853BEB7_9PSEU|nr:ABC transporter substrate-binding protein [Amycolatopsis endophytica]NYI93370.1 peptide/nickel transport system substrate-binding protein [Amycolatopsis endophytica]
MPFSRRDLLRLAGATGAAALLAACGTGGTGAAPAQMTNALTPRRGGTFRAAFTGGAAAESLDPYAGGSAVDFVRNDVIYDSLFVLENGGAAPSLATGLDTAADGRSFVLHLRENVRWHDGSAFTARDVAYSFGYMGDPARAYPSELTGYLDLAHVEVVDDATVRVPTLTPVGDPAVLLAAFPAKMVKDGTTSITAETVNGTGPYRVTAFEAGRETRLARFDGYWGEAAPADELVLLSLTDAQAQVNAVTTGQADYTGDIPFTTAKIGTTAPGLEIRTAGPATRTGFAFVLNATKPPFDDSRVRRAVRLGVDRQALVDTVFLGFGVPGNDLFGAGSRYHDDRAPLARDIEEARRLVAEAGAGGVKIFARTAEYQTGYNAATQLFAEQMKEIGLDVEAQVVGLSEFFEPSALAEAHSVTFGMGTYPLPVAYGRLSGIPSLVLPDEDFATALAEAIATTSEDTRAQAWQRLQDLMFDKGNTVVWGDADILSMAKANVAGVEVHDQAQYPYLGKAGLA